MFMKVNFNFYYQNLFLLKIIFSGPIGIGPNANKRDPGLQEGMILSNEPGYYEQDKFGIRIENLMVVKKKETQVNFFLIKFNLNC